jgi:D-alanine-D-alanine ligase
MTTKKNGIESSASQLDKNFRKNKPKDPTPRVKTIGPVSDLERHLPAEWWRTLFNSIYLKTDADVVENDTNTIREIDLLVRYAGLEHNDKILDLCCGQGRHSLELARRGFKNVTGLDRSRYLVRLAKKRARALSYEVNFHEGDARRFRLPESSFHCVALLGNSFGYFDREEDDIAVLKSVLRVLRSGGTIALDLTDGQWMRENFEKRSWEWIDANHFVCRERNLTKDGARLVSREVVTHAERGVIADQFYAERLYSKEQILELLVKAGFSSIRHHGVLSADSDRNQDLGMMANRHFITAQAPVKVTSPSKKRILFSEVTVLLGDPSLPDPVKLTGKFGKEDLETVEKLKKALNELEGFEFSYLQNHSTLLAELKASPPKFVLNLCDEGFQNSASLELHVPALLELFDIPYTGSAPSCLGLCYNKSFIRAIAASMDIPVPLETYFGADDQAANLPSALPALVKPNFGDSSIGITKNSVVNSPEELVEYLKELRSKLPGCPVLVQEFLTGKEYSVGIIGNPGLRIKALPVLEVDYSNLDQNLPKILGYESKWDPSSPYWSQISYHESRASEEIQRRLIDYSLALFERLGCRDYARFDFRADTDGRIKLLEVNPNPGWCWDGKLNFMAEYAGLRYSDLLLAIIEAAQERVAAKLWLGKVSPVYNQKLAALYA